MAELRHIPVMLGEAVEGLAVQAGGRYLDGTFGRGGHARAVLSRLGPDGRLLLMDRDPTAIAAAREAFADDPRVSIRHGNFAELAEWGETATGLDGVLLDLGVSSRQLDDDARGFSFRPGIALDMRMEGTAGPSAADVLNDSDERELERVFWEFGDEPKARRLAREVARRRARGPFTTSDDLVGAIRAVLGARSGPADFARLFQAVRIAVNDELGGLQRGLVSLRERLAPGGVMAVIAYHSGEDRLVKHAFRAWSTACTCPPRQPLCTCGGVAAGETLTRKPILASDAETAANARARSAHLRAWRRAGP